MFAALYAAFLALGLFGACSHLPLLAIIGILGMLGLLVRAYIVQPPLTHR